MVFYDAIKRTDPNTLRDLAGDWEAVAKVFSESAGKLFDQVINPLRGSYLRGHSIDAAAQRANDLENNARAGADEATAVKTALFDFADAISGIQQELRKVEGEVERIRGMSINEGGVVGYAPAALPNDGPASPEEAEMLDEEMVAKRQGEAEAFTERIRELVTEATNYDSDFTAQLQTICELPTEFGDEQDVSFNGDPEDDITALREANLPDDLGSNPEAAAAWWNGLSPEERDWYIQHHHREIGWADGLPAEARHEASMTTLREDAAAGPDRDNAYALYERIQASRADDDPSNDMYLLGYTPPDPHAPPDHSSLTAYNGADARVIVAVGNPDTAAHTGIYVPGTLTDLESAAGDDLDRAVRLRDEAAGLTDESVSTIMWLGYDAPDDLYSATYDSRAQAAGPSFARFVDGVNAAHDYSGSHVTAVGHSYGSTVIGQADVLSGGLNVDDAVHVGSPGLGPEPDDTPFIDGDVDGVEDIPMDPDHVWGMSTNGDFVNSEWHGDDPSAGDFGGRRLAADDFVGHGGYWEPNGTALRNQALVMTGRYEDVIVDLAIPKIFGLGK